MNLGISISQDCVPKFINYRNLEVQNKTDKLLTLCGDYQVVYYRIQFLLPLCISNCAFHELDNEH